MRDNNEASWTQVLDMLEFMADASDLRSCSTATPATATSTTCAGWCKKLEQRGIAGVCIEDKLFPKTNSFIDGERQPLADVDEFCGKIKAGKDAQTDADFSIVARVEALIAGWGMDEALRRAEAYRAGGRRRDPDPQPALARRRDPGVRAGVGRSRAARDRADQVLQHADRGLPQGRLQRRDLGEPPDARRGIARCRPSQARSTTTETLVNVEDRIAPVNEIFRLQGADELAQRSSVYLPAARTRQRSASCWRRAAAQGWRP